MVGYEPHPAQIPFHLDTHRFRILCCGVRSGKTYAAAHEALAALVCLPDTRGWIIGQTYTLSEKVFREVYRLVNTPIIKPYVDKQSEHTKFIRLDNGSEVVGKSCVEPDQLLGETLDWVVLDEGSRINEEIWSQYIQPRLATKLGWAAIISTPFGKNWFYQAFLKGQDPSDKYYKSWTFSSDVSPYVPEEEFEYHRKNDPDRVFRQEWLAEFISGGGEVFQGLDEIINPKLRISNTPMEGKQYIMGVDVGKQIDFTVIVVMEKQTGRVAYIERFNKMDWARQINHIAELAQDWNGAEVWLDATGAGDPLFDILVRMGTNIYPYKISRTTKIPLIDNLAMCIEREMISVPPWSTDNVLMEVLRELEMFEYSVTDAGNVTYEAPKGQHDDCVISLALAAWGISQSPSARVAPDDIWEITPFGKGGVLPTRNDLGTEFHNFSGRIVDIQAR